MAGKQGGLLSRNNAGLWIFLGAALVVVILLAVFVSPFASKSPDGLDKTAQEKGFAGKAEQNEPAWKHSPMADYSVPGAGSEKTSTGLAGLLGVLITLAVALAAASLIYLFARRRNRDAAEPTIEATAAEASPPA